MSEDTEGGWALTPSADGKTVFLTVSGPTTPTSPPVRLTLAQIEALQKALAVAAAKVRGVKAKPNG